MTRSLLLCSLLAILAACGNTPIFGGPASRDEVYDKACVVDEDCAVISYGSCALCGGCGDDAINVDELARFDADNAVVCPPKDGSFACGACPETRAVCTAATCALRVCDDEACLTDADNGEG